MSAGLPGWGRGADPDPLAGMSGAGGAAGETPTLYWGHEGLTPRPWQHLLLSPSLFEQ